MGLGIITRDVLNASDHLRNIRSKAIRRRDNDAVTHVEVDRNVVNVKHIYDTAPIEEYSYKHRKEVGKGMSKKKHFRTACAIPLHLLNKVKLKAEADLRQFGLIKTLTSDEADLYDGYYRNDDHAMRRWMRRHSEFRTSEGAV